MGSKERGTVRLPVVAAIYAIAIGITVATVSLTYVSAANRGDQVEFGVDYATFHGAALLVVEGDGADMYEPGVLGNRVVEATGYTDQSGDVFVQFPFFALYFVPLTALSFLLGYGVFLLAGILALGWTLSRVGVRRVAPVVGLIAISLPGYWTLHLGQMGFLVSALLFGVFLNLKSERRFTAGLWIGLLVFKPTYAVGIGIWWLLRAVYFRREIAGAAFSALVISLTGFAIPGAWEGYRAFVASEGLAGGDVATSGFSILEMWQTMLPSDSVAMVLWALSAAVVIALFAIAVRRLDHRLEPSMALAVVVGLLVAPRTGWYDWMLLVIPGVLFWQTYPQLRARLVAGGSWVFLAGAVSWLLATGLNDAIGLWFQLAPVVLSGVVFWWVSLLLAHEGADQLELVEAR